MQLTFVLSAMAALAALWVVESRNIFVVNSAFEGKTWMWRDLLPAMIARDTPGQTAALCMGWVLLGFGRLVGPVVDFARAAISFVSIPFCAFRALSGWSRGEQGDHGAVHRMNR